MDKQIKKSARKILIAGMILSLLMQPIVSVRANEISPKFRQKEVQNAETQDKELNILQIGDSNTMMGYLTLNMRDLLMKKAYDTGTGFFALNPDEYFLKKKLDNITYSFEGSWQRFDMAASGKHCMIDNAPNGAYIQGRGKGSTCTIKFSGSALELYYCSEVGTGLLKVDIDGEDGGIVETGQYGDKKIHKVMFDHLENKNHVIKFTLQDDRPVHLDGADAIGKVKEKRTAVHSWGNSSASTKDYAHLDKTMFESGLKAVNPNEVIVLLGTNDVGALAPDNTPEEVEKNVTIILSRIKEALPDAEIWLLSTLETKGNNDLLHEYWNKSLPNAAKKVGVNYWSMGEFYGQFSPDKMLPDGVHINDTGGKMLMNQLYKRMILKRRLNEAVDVEDQLKGYGDKVTGLLTEGIHQAEKVHLNSKASKEEIEEQINILEKLIKAAKQAAQDIRDNKETPRANLLDIDFRDGTPIDSTLFEHRLHIMGNPVIKQNRVLGRNTAEFDGVKDAFSYQMDNADCEILKKGYTLECMVKLAPQESNDAVLFDTGRGAFKLSVKNNKIFFSEKRTEQKILSHVIQPGKWTHLTVSSDGKRLNLYLNGKLKESENCSGELELPSQIKKFFTIGGETADGRKLQNSSKAIVDSVRLYSRVLTAKGIKKLYWQDEKTEILLPSGKKFRAVEGDLYKIPTASVETATGEKAQADTKLEDSEGKIVELSQGMFKAKSGKYKIIYEANKKIKAANLNVLSKEENTPVTENEKVLPKGETCRLDIQNKKDDAKISFKCENSEIASVDSDGTVHAKRTGQTGIRILIEQTGHVYDLCVKIVVGENPGVADKKVMTAGEQSVLSIVHKTKTARAEFSSTSPSVASVDSYGRVYAKKTGEAVIRTAINQDGYSYIFYTRIIVRAKSVTPSATVKGYVKFTRAKRTIKRGKSYTFKAKAYGTEQKLKWSVSNKKLAKISKKGKFAAKKKKGKVYVIVKSGKYTKKFLVKIK